MRQLPDHHGNPTANLTGSNFHYSATGDMKRAVKLIEMGYGGKGFVR